MAFWSSVRIIALLERRSRIFLQQYSSGSFVQNRFFDLQGGILGYVKNIRIIIVICDRTPSKFIKMQTLHREPESDSPSKTIFGILIVLASPLINIKARGYGFAQEPWFSKSDIEFLCSGYSDRYSGCL